MSTRLNDLERDRIEAGLAAICKRAGLDPTGAELARFTMNAVYRLPSAGVVVRMRTGPNAATQVTHLAQVAISLAELELPTARLAQGLAQPVHADGWSATVWTLLDQPPCRRFAPVDLAGPLRALHSVAELPVPLRQWDVTGKVEKRLAETRKATGSARDFLTHWAMKAVGLPLDDILGRLGEQCDQLTSRLRAVEWTLPQTVVHGDAHAGNLLRGPSGEVVIGDLDSISAGPPEWDLIPAAHGVIRFGDDPDRYTALADAYGLDVMSCPAWDTLVQVRELQLLTSVITNLPGRPEVAEQLAARLRSSLAGDRTAMWRRYR